MAKLNEMILFDPAGPPMSGCAFLLSGPSKAALSVVTPGGWTVQTARGSQYVAAQTTTVLHGYDNTRVQAFHAAQEGLDLWAIARSADLGIRDAEIEHITWWPEAAGQVLRVTHVTTISPVIGATAIVRDTAGNVVPSPPTPPPVWHDCLRYFRLSQTTDDLFDAYRNLYLAVESILDRIAPQAVNATTGKPSEGEGLWFKRALGIANSRVPLSTFATPGAADPVQDLYDELYVRTRTALFHAKTSRPSILPHTPGHGRSVVSSAVDRLSRMFIALAENELNTRSGMSGFFDAGFKMMTEHLVKNLRLQATDDPASANPENEVINPSGGNVVDLTTRNAPELEERFLRSFIGVAEAPAIGSLRHLAGVGATLGSGPLVGGTIEGILSLEGVQRLEAQMGIRLRNVQQPRRHFSS